MVKSLTTTSKDLAGYPWPLNLSHVGKNRDGEAGWGLNSGGMGFRLSWRRKGGRTKNHLDEVVGRRSHWDIRRGVMTRWGRLDGEDTRTEPQTSSPDSWYAL